MDLIYEEFNLDVENDPLEQETIEFDEIDQWIWDDDVLQQDLYNNKIGLSNQDFNLNSPLIKDEIEYASNYMHKAQRDPRFAHLDDDLKLLKKVLIKLKVPLIHLSSPDIHHNLIHDLLYNDDTSICKEDVLERWREVWEMTKDIPEITERFILNAEPDPPAYDTRFDRLHGWRNEDIELGREWNSFINLHFITHLMNSSSVYGVPNWTKELLKLKTWKSKPEWDSIKVLGESSTRFVWVVTKKFAYHKSTNCLLDKNFLLMLKDIALARVMSKLSLLSRTDRQTGDDDYLKMRLLYHQGDRLLSSFGNNAYKVIKLIEAVCTERWNELGQSHRPLIPLSSTLRDHLERTLQEFPEMLGQANNFFRIVKLEQDPWMVGQFYGAFRHWGHPYINYMDGLHSLFSRVTEHIEVDRDYANVLASDLAFIVLKDQFYKRKKWFATTYGLEHDSPLKKCIEEGVWPTAKVIEDFGHNWHTLELLPCFDIPDTIDMTDLYSDKAHSMIRSDVLKHIQLNPYKPIPALRVMETLLRTQCPNIPEFLRELNEDGFTWEDLVIGLKAKERELKDAGRYFALMSWRLRLYFVITEYLIKLHFVPLFSGLTVADDLTTMTKKLLTATKGQGLDTYDKIYVANSLDYEKWNNRQRFESNNPVFTVMGKFLGYPNIISLTHIAFQNSLIYYNDRPDLMVVENGRVYNKEGATVCWEGQLGGFEGLRQKGWSILNYLVLRREALTRNTGTRFLAQGDNQIVITQYTLVSKNTDEAMKREVLNIWENNQTIMDRIRKATGKLGLKINEDEVVTSAELLIYGKVPVYRGKVIPLETKRWSRVSTVTNDQIPNFANSIAGGTTAALSVSQHSEDPIEILYQHNFFGAFCGAMLSLFNPITGADPIRYHCTDFDKRREFFVRLLYKDPSVGGVCGTNLLRFFLSRFPDPVTESLTWWRLMYDNTEDHVIRRIAVECGNPRLGTQTLEAQTRLLEDPTSLNIPSGLSSNTMIKNKVKEGLLDLARTERLENRLVKESLLYTDHYHEQFVSWLLSIRPVFPRFLSEFYTGTYFRIAEGIVSVFQNSRTIKKVFSRKFPNEVYKVILKSEIYSIASLYKGFKGDLFDDIWDCSASRADQLRTLSWGPNLIGVTTPHPAEMLVERYCIYNCDGPHAVSKKIPLSKRSRWTRGPLTPYLGSKTKESTSVHQPWEKQIDVAFLRRANDLRRAINWFVVPGSNLAESIYNNLYSLTGIDLRDEVRNYQRTGSSKHRLRCARVSNEGVPGVGFNFLMYTTVTTDTMGDINEENYDFMYQSLLIWASVISTLRTNPYSETDTTHFHIRDKLCLRVIEEEILESPTIFEFQDMSRSVRTMLAHDLEVKHVPRISIPWNLNWDEQENQLQSWYLGRAQGFLWGVAVYDNTTDEAATTLFPTSITRKVSPLVYMEGIARGFCLGATLTPLYTRYGSLSEKARLKFEGSYWDIVDRAVLMTNLSNMVNHSQFRPFLRRTGADIIKSYPALPLEVSDVLKRWFLKRLIADREVDDRWVTYDVVIFADMYTEYVIGLFRTAEAILPVFRHEKLSGDDLKKLNRAKRTLELLAAYNESKITREQFDLLEECLRNPDYPGYHVVSSEARHAASRMVPPVVHIEQVVWKQYNEYSGTGGSRVRLDYQPLDEDPTNWPGYQLRVKQIRCTLMSSLRVVQLSTGAHYKYKDIMAEFETSGDGIFCGDGSGGIGANHLRKYSGSRVIFNSKLDLGGESFKGLAPAGPGAYTMSGDEVCGRCVNYNSCWEDPSDLSEVPTWENFLSIIKTHQLDIRIICCDAEVQDDTTSDKIEQLLLEYSLKILRGKNALVIYKTYWRRITQTHTFIHRAGFYYSEVYAFMPDSQGSFTSEVYLICKGLKQPDSPTPTVLTNTSMREIYSALKVNATSDNEFARGRAFGLDNIAVGLYDHVPYRSLEDIAIFLASVGTDTGFALWISEALRLECRKGLHPFNVMWILGFVVTRHVLPVTSWYRRTMKMPVSTQLQRAVACMFGIWFGVSFMFKDNISFRLINERYQRESAVSVGLSGPIYKKKSKKLLGHFTTWRFGLGKNMKMVDPGPKAGITQQMTRLIYMLYGGRPIQRDYTQEDEKVCDGILGKLDRNAKVSILKARSGISYMQWGATNPLEIDPQLEDQIEVQEEPLGDETGELD
ncbi:RNA polymerase [Zahedan rhabdovirus]|uniref:Replicase n=1 Tax=Zahedan rhabdovirus TaxID=1620507 RepID=A0A0R6C679_9RHAB|nr:RNA polymerase [Zahedan rhabdovirus]AJR16768.1 RNA polymerase [Zahedan rhabdovirus]